jgi:archaeal flagellar protein FlaI
MGFLDDLKKNITKDSNKKISSKNLDITMPKDSNNPNPNINNEPNIKDQEFGNIKLNSNENDEKLFIKDKIKKDNTSRGLHREENIFSFKPNIDALIKEKEIYENLQKYPELESGTKWEISSKELSNTPIQNENSKNLKISKKNLDSQKNSLQQLRMMAKFENENNLKNKINLNNSFQNTESPNTSFSNNLSTIKDYSKTNYENNSVKKITPKVSINPQKIEFNLDKKNLIKPATEKDSIRTNFINTKNESSPIQTNKFGWDKKDIIPQQKTNNFINEKNENQINENLLSNKEPNSNKKTNLINNQIDEIDSTKIDSTNYLNPHSDEINWMNEEKIEKPNIEDFYDKKEYQKENKPVNHDWLNSDIKEEIINLPKGMEISPKKINSEIGKKVITDNNSPQVNWLEGDLDETTLEEDVLNDEQKIIGPKWINKNSNSVKKEPPQTMGYINTPIDKMFDLLTSYKSANINELSEYCGLNPDSVELISRKFEEHEITELKYYTTPGKRPSVIFKNDVPSNIRDIPKGTIIDKYEMVVDFVKILVTIVEVEGEPRPIYTLGTPTIGKYTRKFLDIVKDEVAETMPIELDEILDPRKSKKLKVRFFKELTTNLSRYLPNISEDIINPLSGLVLHELYGLGDIELFMADDMLEEVAINSAKTPLTVYHRIYGWMKTNVFLDSEERIINYSSQIGRKIGREITTLKPILDAHLLSGDRVNATLFPISSEGNTLTIRRFARKPWTIIDFIGKAHTMTTEMAAFLWLAMQYEMNVIVAGGTASGKTSALNTLLAMVPPYHRILSIEDVREIILPKYLMWNWVSLVTRSPNPEGLGEVTMLELMQSSLRMRPDRIIVGEIRRHKEAEVLMEAIETGHSIYSTIHANSGYQVLRRLVEPPMNIPPLQVELLDIIIVQYRDRKTNKRRTYEISEIEQTSSGQGLQINTIYKWSPRNDSWDKLSKPVKLLTLLNLHTGLTEEDVTKELKDRELILNWMTNNNITSLDDIGLVMKIFYSNPEKVKTLARKNVSIEEFKEKIYN